MAGGLRVARFVLDLAAAQIAHNLWRQRGGRLFSSAALDLGRNVSSSDGAPILSGEIV